MFNWSDKFYKYVKWSVLLLIPTLGLAYQKLGAIWGFPLIEQVKETVDVVVYCLAVVLGINCAEYSGTVEGLKANLDTVEVTPLPKEVVVIPEVTEEAETTAEDAVKESATEEASAEPATDEVTAEPVTDNEVEGTCVCEAGKEYILTDNLKVRESFGTDARWLTRGELSADGQAHSQDGEMAVLSSGTSVTCLEVVSNWIRIPSGWICARIDGVDTVKEGDASEAKINAIRTQLAQWSDPRNQGFRGMCEGFVFTIYDRVGLSYRGMNHSYCCANANRDANAEGGDPSNGDIVYSGDYANEICDCCGRHCGHVAIFMDGYAYGAQSPDYACPWDTWVASFGYGGHSNLGNW